MATPWSLENTYRAHDSAVYDWLGGCRVDYDSISGKALKNQPILRVFATRQRLVATVVDLLVYQDWISGATAAQMKQNAEDNFAVLPLPVASITRGDLLVDPDHTGVPKTLRRGRFNQATGMWETHAWPGAWEVPYTITFWSIKRYTEAFIREWILSQVGKVGMGSNEVLISVKHAQPWGTKNQALRFDGTTDQSELEGNEQRWIRFEASFVLKMLHFRPAIASFDFVAAVEEPIYLSGLADNVLRDPLSGTPDDPDTRAGQVSGNLFQPYTEDPKRIDEEWPVGGAATVKASTASPDGTPPDDFLEIQATARADVVDLVNRAVYLPSQPSRAVLQVAFEYLSDRDFRVNVSQHSGASSTPVWSSARLLTLAAAPTTWTRCQLFTLLTQQIFDVSIEGPGGTQVATIRIGQVDVRQAFTPGVTLTPTSGTGFSGTKYVFLGLTKYVSYLIVVAPTVLGSGQWTIRAEDDQAAPGVVRKRVFDEVTEKGYVELMSPKSDSLAVTLPTGFPASTIYAQPYPAGLYARPVLAAT